MFKVSEYVDNWSMHCGPFDRPGISFYELSFFNGANSVRTHTLTVDSFNELLPLLRESDQDLYCRIVSISTIPRTVFDYVFSFSDGAQKYKLSVLAYDYHSALETLVKSREYGALCVPDMVWTGYHKADVTHDRNKNKSEVMEVSA